MNTAQDKVITDLPRFSLKSLIALVSFTCLLLGLAMAGLSEFAFELFGCSVMFVIGATAARLSMPTELTTSKRQLWLAAFVAIGIAIWLKKYFIDEATVSRTLMSGAVPLFLGVGSFLNFRVSTPEPRRSQTFRRLVVTGTLLLLTAWGILRWSELRQHRIIGEQTLRISNRGFRVRGGGVVLEYWGPIRMTKTYTLSADAQLRRISNDDLEAVGTCRLVRLLDLGNTSVDDDGLAHLRRLHRLHELSLSGTAVTDAGLVHLANLPNLKRLNLGETAISPTAIARLKRANRSLIVTE